jgi:hypothetical protein
MNMHEEARMDVSSATLSGAQQSVQANVQASLQAVQQMMQQELELIEAMAGAAPIAAAAPAGVGTLVDVTA